MRNIPTILLITIVSTAFTLQVFGCEYREYEATAYYCTGTTASGTQTTAGRTLGVDPDKIPYGSTVAIYINDGGKPGEFIGYYIAEDTGPAAKGQAVVDIYMPDRDACIQFGRQKVLLIVFKGAAG